LTDGWANSNIMRVMMRVSYYIMCVCVSIQLTNHVSFLTADKGEIL